MIYSVEQQAEALKKREAPACSSNNTTNYNNNGAKYMYSIAVTKQKNQTKYQNGI